MRALTDHAQTNGPGTITLSSIRQVRANPIPLPGLPTGYRAYTTQTTRRFFFHSVVVITDRRVLDQQLQNTIFSLSTSWGGAKIDENTQQLAKALADGVPIIISTIQNSHL